MKRQWMRKPCLLPHNERDPHPSLPCFCVCTWITRSIKNESPAVPTDKEKGTSWDLESYLQTVGVGERSHNTQESVISFHARNAR